MRLSIQSSRRRGKMTRFPRFGRCGTQTCPSTGRAGTTTRNEDLSPALNFDLSRVVKFSTGYIVKQPPEFLFFCARKRRDGRLEGLPDTTRSTTTGIFEVLLCPHASGRSAPQSWSFHNHGRIVLAPAMPTTVTRQLGRAARRPRASSPRPLPHTASSAFSEFTTVRNDEKPSRFCKNI